MKSISQYVRDQFPAIYKDMGEDFITFIEAYYEYMTQYHSVNRENLSAINVDETLPQYIKFFRSTYLKNFPYVSASDPKFVIKNIRDFYSSKGTELSTELLLKMLFGENSSTYYPGLDVLKPSDSKWFQPIYLEVSHTARNANFVDKQIIGSKSNARAIVEGVVTKRVNGKYVDVMYLSALQGNFATGESVSENGNMRGAPIVIGSLSEVTVVNGGRNNRVGDVFDVKYENGRQGKVRVSETENATGRVDFSILDGGSGYTVTNRTSVYISDGVLFLNNPKQDFIDFETVSQKMETLSLLATENLAPHLEPGKQLTGFNERGENTATGTIISVDNGTEGGVASALVKLLINNGTFNTQNRLTVLENSNFILGEVVEEESSLTLTLANSTGTMTVGSKIEQIKTADYGSMRASISFNSIAGGTFTVGETIYQNNAAGELAATGKIIEVSGSTMKIRSIQKFAAPGVIETGRRIYGMTSGANANVTLYTPEAAASLYLNYAFGTIRSIAGNVVNIDTAWGTFEAGSGAIIKNAAGAQTGTATIELLEVTEAGARATISTKVSPTVIVTQNIFGQFTIGKKIRGAKSGQVKTLSLIGNDGATDIAATGVLSANAIIDTIANTTASAIIIGQNTTAVGIHGNTNPFLSSGDVNLESTLRNISSLSIWTGSQINIEVSENHTFVVNDTLNVSIDLQQSDEVKYLKNLFRVIAVPNNRTVRIDSGPEFADVVREGGFSLFPSTIQKTVEINLGTDRKGLISPPRNAAGDIIEISRPVISISTGVGASFAVGQIENAETVFLDTDIVGGDNISGTPYLGINIDASNSGVGFIDTIQVTNGGTGYANGQVMTFTGGGYAGGDPLIPATAVISTTPAGVISTVTVTDPGQGYWSTPTIVWPSGNASATVTVLGDFGYGFPKTPNGDAETYLDDLWTSEEFTIGTIASLSNINPGKNYNADPFVRVYNSFIAGFGRSDFVLTVGTAAGGFIRGESVSQSIGGGEGEAEVQYAKGFVIGTAADQIIIRRTSFNTGFVANTPVVGVQSGASAMVEFASQIEDSRVMGDNSTIEGKVVAANGIATKLEVIDSGYGYEHNENVVLSSENTPFVVTGVAKVGKQGMGQGFWKTFTSHLDGPSKIHDNDYYQEYSYEIVTSNSLEQYASILEELVHVAGNKLFGKVEKRSEFDLIGSQVDGMIEVSTHITAQGFWDDYYSWADSTTFDETLAQQLDHIEVENKTLFYPSLKTLYTDDKVTNATAPGDLIKTWAGSNGEWLVAPTGSEPILARMPKGGVVYNMVSFSDDFSKSVTFSDKRGLENAGNDLVPLPGVSYKGFIVNLPEPVKAGVQYTVSFDLNIIRTGYTNGGIFPFQVAPGSGFSGTAFQNFRTDTYAATNGVGCDAASCLKLGINRIIAHTTWTATSDHPSPTMHFAFTIVPTTNSRLGQINVPVGPRKGFTLNRVQVREGAGITMLQKKNGKYDVSERGKTTEYYLNFDGKRMSSESNRMTDNVKGMAMSICSRKFGNGVSQIMSSVPFNLIPVPSNAAAISASSLSGLQDSFSVFSNTFTDGMIENRVTYLPENVGFDTKTIYTNIIAKEFASYMNSVSNSMTVFDQYDTSNMKMLNTHYEIGDQTTPSNNLVGVFGVISGDDATIQKAEAMDAIVAKYAR